MLSNAYFLAKFRFDTAENEPAENLQNLPILLTALRAEVASAGGPRAGRRPAGEKLRAVREPRVFLPQFSCCRMGRLLHSASAPDVAAAAVGRHVAEDELPCAPRQLHVFRLPHLLRRELLH